MVRRKEGLAIIATRVGQWPRAHPRKLAAACAIVLLLVGWSWPGDAPPHRFPDSIDYLNWPEPSKPDGLTRLGPRMPGYPLLLRVVGVGPALTHVQTWLSLASWCALGALLAGVPGLLLGGLFTLAPELRVWNDVVLSESPSFSLIALLTTLSLLLARRFRIGLFAVWCVLLLLFALMRPSNVVVVPAFVVPLLAGVSGAGISGTGRAAIDARHLVAAASIALAVMMTAAYFSERSAFWRMNYYISLLDRVVPSAEARDYFHAHGMPKPLLLRSDEFAAWFESDGRRTYEAWVLSRPVSYAQAWYWLAPEGQQAEIRRRYIDVAGVGWVDGVTSQIGGAVFRLASPPGPVWLAILVLPIAEVWRRGRPGALGLFAAALVPIAYVQCFLSFHASAAEVVRHTLGASILHRLAFCAALVATASLVREAWTKRRGGDVV